jgi:hypothetical protein
MAAGEEEFEPLIGERRLTVGILSLVLLTRARLLESGQGL